MATQQSVAASGKPLPETEMSMKELWADAAKAFEKICGESLQKGEVKSFDDVQKKIEGSTKASYGLDPGPEDKWDKAKSVGLKSLKYLKMLVGAASQASCFIPIPGAAASITATALSFVFDIPETVKGYNDAIDQVFGEVSSALSQFKIYNSMENVDPLLIKQIHLVLVSFVKVCGYVVQYRQSRKRDRFLRQMKFVLDGQSDLAGEMSEFKRVLQQQRDVEGTLTLSVVVETKQDVAQLLEQSIVFGKLTEETHQAVQSLKDDADRIKRLIKIRDSLGVWPTVRLESNTTETCTKIADKCLPGTGTWIWDHEAYKEWAMPEDKDKDKPHLLITSGPASSGKTSACALITKRLEEQKGRAYVAHYFFPASIKKTDDDKNNPIHVALKYMAFQIARVDVTVRNALGKACESDANPFRRSTSPEGLDVLWKELKIGTTGSGASYYLVFDGLEHLSDQHAELLLKFILRMSGDSSGRVHILASGTDERFANEPTIQDALRIRMEEQNRQDMGIFIEEELNRGGVLQKAKPGSEQQKARDKIIAKLPQNVSGSYSRLRFGLEDVIRLLSTRAAVRELDQMLDQSISSHEAAIKNLQRSLTADEISELNELLKWVLFGNVPMKLDDLEAVMFIFSGIESLASLKSIIKNKYSAVLKIEDDYVYGQDGVKDYLQKEKEDSGPRLHSKDRSTISMTITVNNVDEQLCGHFLWDLTHKAIRDKFKFNFEGDGTSALHSSNQGVIAVDEFEAHHTIVRRAFDYLKREPKEQAEVIAEYCVWWLPHHLNRLRELEDAEKGELLPSEKFDIAQDLYELFKNDATFRRHKVSFEKTFWYPEEMENVQKWFNDTGVVRKLDKTWRADVQGAANPVRGYLKELAKIVVRGLLRERTWSTRSWWWIYYSMKLEKKDGQDSPNSSGADANTSNNTNNAMVDNAEGGVEDDNPLNIDWEGVSTWCQEILQLPDSELDSLWFERLAEVANIEATMPEASLMLYKRAIEKKDSSWLCHRGLGTAYYNKGQYAEALEQAEIALKEAEREEATPKPEAKAITDLHLVLGRYAYLAKQVEKSAQHYAIACKSEDTEQANEGLLGHMRAMLESPDTEATTKFLKESFDPEGDEKKMTSLLKLMALDDQHDEISFQMFRMAKKDPDLLKTIVHLMEKATEGPLLDDAEELAEGDDHLAKWARGVLLYDRGVAAYTYKVVPEDTDPINEGLRLWKESRDQLSNVGGHVSYITRQRATAALASHYFQGVVDGTHLGYLDSLAKLDESDGNYSLNEAIGFRGAALAIGGNMDEARAVLAPKVQWGLQILSDDIPDNDWAGLSAMQNTLGFYQDFENAAVAVSLMISQDIVSEALQFKASDVASGENEQAVLDMANKLARETVQAVRTQIPDTSQQAERIEAAVAHVASLVAAANAKPDGQDGNETTVAVDPVTVSAHSLLQSRVSDMYQKHTPKINPSIDWTCSCDGYTPEGRSCNNATSFDSEFYHCVYCANKDFCRDCLARLRDPAADMQMTGCSPKHKWMWMAPQGADIYVGTEAKAIHVPTGIEFVGGDEQIIRPCYAGNGAGQMMDVEAWKEKLAQEWGISLDEIKDKISRENTPDSSVEGE